MADGENVEWDAEVPPVPEPQLPNTAAAGTVTLCQNIHIRTNKGFRAIRYYVQCRSIRGCSGHNCWKASNKHQHLSMKIFIFKTWITETRCTYLKLKVGLTLYYIAAWRLPKNLCVLAQRFCEQLLGERQSNEILWEKCLFLTSCT